MLRGCAFPGCPELVERGCCLAHTRPVEDHRRSSAERGYTSTWRAFRLRFARMLIAAEVAPSCGAALPGGPAPTESRCRAEGVINNRDLHLHHSPPLTAAEREDRRAIENPMRVIFLCGQCHRAVRR